jgi:hypothetical protein
MPFDPNEFPVAETDANLITYAKGNLVSVPPGTTYMFATGRVTDVRRGKPGGVMLVTVEEDASGRAVSG